MEIVGVSVWSFIWVFALGFGAALVLAFFIRRREYSFINKQREFFENEKRHIAKVERYSALGDFGAGIAHEINNPLAIILGRTQSLKIRLDKDRFEKKDVMETLEKIEGAVKRISKIVNALRLMTKDSSDEYATVVSISIFLEDIESVWAARFRNNGFEFSIENNCPEVMTMVKRTQVAHALFNLISNSFEFLKNEKDKWIKIDVQEKDGYAQIGITDSGPGIPLEIRRKIFEPFYTTKEVGKGTGLGLSSAKGVAEDNKGLLEYDDQSPHTRFVLSLPKFEGEKKVAA